MPGLTRMRADAAGAPQPIAAEYYSQRASAGLIITEATAISVNGRGYPQMPGVYSPEQIAGWRAVTQAVHAKGGRIVQQIVHHGRWSHSSYNPDGSLPVAPSAIAPPGLAYTPDFRQVPYETPRALETHELPGIVEAFWQAARNAMDAGFDGVKSTARTASCSTSFCRTAAIIAPTPMAARSRTAAGSCSRSSTRSPTPSEAIAPRSDSLRMAISAA